MSLPTIFELAHAKLTEPEPYLELLQRTDHAAIPHIATVRLKQLGAKLTSDDPRLLDYAQRKMAEEVEAVLDQVVERGWQSSKTGRPQASIEHDQILTAAFFKFRREGLGLTAARRSAAEYLGSPTRPITKDQVEKATVRFVKRTWQAFRPICAEPDVWRLAAKILSDVTHQLQDCEHEIEGLRRAQCQRRYCTI